MPFGIRQFNRINILLQFGRLYPNRIDILHDEIYNKIMFTFSNNNKKKK